jgi:hypothetical protein
MINDANNHEYMNGGRIPWPTATAMQWQMGYTINKINNVLRRKEQYCM